MIEVIERWQHGDLEDVRPDHSDHPFGIAANCAESGRDVATASHSSSSTIAVSTSR